MARPHGRRVVAAVATFAGVATAVGAGLRGASSAPAAAQAVQRAGLVVQLGPDDVRTFCVAFDEPSITGEALLRRSGLAIAAEVGVLGTLVCRIDEVGCDHPREACWCRCRSLGAGCTYWGYSILDGDRWAFSPLGAHARVVRDGDVDGWAWGAGAITTGAVPPVRTFAEVCGAPATAEPVPERGSPVTAVVQAVGTASASDGPPAMSASSSTVWSTTPRGRAGDGDVAGAAPRPSATPPALGTAGGRTTARAPSSAPGARDGAAGGPSRADLAPDAARPSAGDGATSLPRDGRRRSSPPPADGNPRGAARPGSPPAPRWADGAALAVYAALVAGLAAAAWWMRRAR